MKYRLTKDTPVTSNAGGAFFIPKDTILELEEVKEYQSNVIKNYMDGYAEYILQHTMKDEDFMKHMNEKVLKNGLIGNYELEEVKEMQYATGSGGSIPKEEKEWPQEGDEYWYVYIDENDVGITHHIACGGYKEEIADFRTEQEAQKAADYIRKVLINRSWE